MPAEYAGKRRFWQLSIASLALILVLASIASLCVGPAPIPFDVALKAVLKNTPLINTLLEPQGLFSNLSPQGEAIVIDIRLPRILTCVFAGAALSLAGAILQGIFRNPMADPYVIGISSGAALGATVAFATGLGFTVFGAAAVPTLAFISSLLTVLLVYNIAKVGGKVPVMTLLLSGIAVSIFLSAFTTLLITFSGEVLHGIYFWLLGSFAFAKWADFYVVAPLTAVGFMVTYFYARDLNIMLLGEETALTLGVNVENVKKALIAVSSLVTAAAVSVSGIIAFVGLIIPHIMRIIVGPDHRVLLPASLLAGGLFLLLCDDLARTALPPIELPIGVITAMFGGPFFIYLLRRKKGEYSL
ncbi:MAG: iron ABC transporter permease [Candidatus Methanomethylicota archaeon]|uniref:Iron ABC transporter permease n=1 Tax=Thermoproteota archaeon TaxID=2056631 RepID=A0A497ET87_9CREN|nr:MAG: iron ABC transporter permease [Candidatus Verstraetearchaeota archaeon]RLE51689.1 MAG: iron ABC transporter permease [Candidatus Verstraetearchaeota archaeon]